MQTDKRYAVPDRRGALRFLVASWSGILCLNAAAADWPQFRGPTGDGICTERILKAWPIEGLRQLWRRPLTDGFSSFAVGGGRAYTQVKRSVGGVSREVCLGLNADTGEELWATPVGTAKYDAGGSSGTLDNSGGDGPRSTPTLKGDRVFVLSSYLGLYCLDATSGAVVWSRDLQADFGGKVIPWQNSASPLIEEDLLLVNCNGPNQTLLALHPGDGTVAWNGQGDKMTHATPVVATIQGTRQVVFFAQSGLVSVLAQTGQVLWRYRFPYSTSTGASPVVAGDLVYCSAGYGIGAATVRVTKTGGAWRVSEVWRTPGALESQWSTPVHHNGYLYGIYGHGRFGYAPLKCVELATGNEMWSQDGFGPGGVLLVDNTLLILTDVGELVLVEPNPAAYTETARYAALSGKCWNVAAVSNGRVYARSTKEAAAFDVAVQPPPSLRFEAPLRLADDGLQLRVNTVDGTAIDPDRAARIEVWCSGNLLDTPSAWTKLDLLPQVANGVWQVEDKLNRTLPQRYYIVVERP